MARGEWPEIFAGILKLAKGVNKPHPSMLEFRAATWLGERFFPEPRGPALSLRNLAGLVKGSRDGIVWTFQKPS
jgi:hypothetical protein